MNTLEGGKMRNKIIGCFFFLLLIFSAGCAEKNAARKEITLAWWGGLYNRASGQKVVDAYNSKNPPVKVKFYTPAPGGSAQYQAKLLTMIAGGTPPDIMLISQESHLEFASKGIFLPLDKYEKDPEFQSLKKDTWASIWKGSMYNGHLYTIPIWTNTIGIFYNKTLFDKAGVSYPAPDWTFDDLLKKAKKLTFVNGNGRIDQFGFGGIPLNPGMWSLGMLIESFGGELYSQDEKECLLNSKTAMKAVRWAIDLSNKYHVSPTIIEQTSRGIRSASTSGGDYFRAGKMAMVLWGRWYIATLKKTKNLRWGVAPYPRGKEKVMYQFPAYLGISSKTKYPEASWRFLKFMLGKEGQQLLSDNRSDMPVLKAVAYSKSFLNYGGRPDANKVFLDMLKYAKMPPYIPHYSEWESRADEMLELVAMGRMNLKKASDKIVEEYKNMVVKRGE
jgi:multiple sugar transport system substrate-binding protein